MAKIYGLFGTMTGKLADTVMSVRNGEQLARKYQPIVFNPSTPAQVAQRAKMKLMSQLSAIMAPVIAIRREGSRSARNIFTKVNFPATSYADNNASITLEQVQLTKSVVGLPSVGANRSTTAIDVFLTGPGEGLSRVVYAAFEKINDTLSFIGSAVSTVQGEENFHWGTILPLSNNEVVIYAYGVRDNTEAARVAFSNLTALSASAVATLLTSRSLTESDVTLTKTEARTLALVSRDGDDNKKSSKKA